MSYLLTWELPAWDGDATVCIKWKLCLRPVVVWGPTFRKLHSAIGYLTGWGVRAGERFGSLCGRNGSYGDGHQYLAPRECWVSKSPERRTLRVPGVWKASGKGDPSQEPEKQWPERPLKTRRDSVIRGREGDGSIGCPVVSGAAEQPGRLRMRCGH